MQRLHAKTSLSSARYVGKVSEAAGLSGCVCYVVCCVGVLWCVVWVCYVVCCVGVLCACLMRL